MEEKIVFIKNQTKIDVWFQGRTYKVWTLSLFSSANFELKMFKAGVITYDTFLKKYIYVNKSATFTEDDLIIISQYLDNLNSGEDDN